MVSDLEDEDDSDDDELVATLGSNHKPPRLVLEPATPAVVEDSEIESSRLRPSNFLAL